MIVRRLTIAGTAVFLAVIALWIMADSLRLAAAPPFQAGDDPIVVSNKWCEFDLDYDNDGESNGSFNPDDGSYFPKKPPFWGSATSLSPPPSKAPSSSTPSWTTGGRKSR